MPLHVILTAAALLVSGLAQAAPPAADVKRGQALFRAKCASCHSVACNRLGPKLEGIVGRKAGSIADFRGYSAALRASGIVWQDDTLDAFLRDGATLVPGNVMTGTFPAVIDAKERKALVDHMKRQDRSLDLC